METKEKKRIEEKRASSVEPIAIVGMSCRFPKAPTLGAFWELLRNGKDTIEEIPGDRWNASDYFDEDPMAGRKTNQRHASMLENIHDFDPLFFSISPAEAVEMNPSQKLMLELVWEAIESSTIPYKKVQGNKVGVYVGNIWSDFEHHRKHKNALVTSHSAMGQSSNIIANRVSFTFGFTGPSLVVDTGCSSSLVALHLACQSLWDNSTVMAFAAGVNHILDPDQYILLSKFGGLSSTGKCNTFDREANGFVRGEGAAVLLLKKLSQAEKDGDTIHALIRGTAMNNNGYNVSLPATSVAGQMQVLADAYANSGIAPHEVHYVEAHGTGTKLGDPTEARALGEFFREGRHETSLHIGSVKTNIGHLEGAAGMAGLIKVVLAMRHKELPPTLNYRTPNPLIPFDDLKLSVQHELGLWPANHCESLKAGINSFGWGGTNAHTVIEEYKPVIKPNSSLPREEGRCCLPLSAKSAPALKAYATSYLHSLQYCSENTFKKICAASAILKPSFDHRVMFSATDKDGMIKALQDFIEDPGEITPRNPHTHENKIVMIFPGQGSQWAGMGQELFREEPTFRQAIEECHEAFKPYINWSLTEQLFAAAEESLLHEIDVIQPMLFAMQVALAKLWMSWGIKPHAVAGHSMGEVAATYISGAIALDDAANIICTRSKLMKTVSGKGGTMAVTELSLAEAEKIVQRYPLLSVAASNSPRSTVLAGDHHVINHVLAELESQERFCRLVKVDVASHSQQMDPLKELLRSALQHVAPVPHIIPIYSTVKGNPVAGEDLNADYWVDNLRNTVQFHSVINNLIHTGHTCFIEVSPHPVLTNAVTECAEDKKTTVLSLASLYREKPEQDSIYKNLGDMFSRGYDVNWEDFYRMHTAPEVDLPSYPFQRERYELEDKSGEMIRKKGSSLLGNAIHLAGSETLCFWETEISLSAFPYLRDHQINGSSVLPGAAYVEMVLEAAHELYSHGTPVISNLRFVKSITLTHEETSALQLKLHQQNKISVFEFFVRVSKNTGRPDWELLAKGELTIQPDQRETEKIIPECSPDTQSANSYYESLTLLGLQYGTYFQGLKKLSRDHHYPDKIHFSLQADNRIISSSGQYNIHPAFLDSFFQPLFYKIIEGKNRKSRSTTFLTDIGEIRKLGPIDHAKELHGIATLKELKHDENRGFILCEADIEIRDSDGSLLLRIKRLKGKTIDMGFIEQRKEKLKNWLYAINWVKSEKENIVIEPRLTNGAWIILGDPYGVSEILVRKMKAQNISCIHVTPGTSFSNSKNDSYTIRYENKEDYAQLIQNLIVRSDQKIEGILHAGSMSYTWQDPHLTADVVEEQQVYGSISMICLHQQLTALNLAELPKLVIVTNGIHSVKAEHDVAQPVHSPLWGMVKVMFNELTQYHCRYFDLSANPGMEELDQIVTEIQISGRQENEIVLRGNDQYVPRLVAPAHDEIPVAQRKQFSPSGTYLITGFRGMGFIFIEWMIRQGARNFALVSRTGETSSPVSDRISILESQGCRFTIFKADTGNYHELKSVMAEIESSMMELKGVVHAAGLIEAKTLTDIDPAAFLRILNPKVKGAWNLHLLTQQKSLDCFIMFSSASTLIGLSGQGSYVAANAFLDTLAHSRKLMGLPGMSVNWGVIKDVGMVASKAELERYARAEGFEPVTMQDAMEVFNLIYDSEYTQIGIAKLNARSVANYYSALGQTRYFRGLLQKETNVKKEESRFADNFSSLGSHEERTAALEQLIIQHVAIVVKISAKKIKPVMTFKGLGLDSLMAIQLWNLLEKSLNVKLALAMFRSHPSIQEYTALLCDLLEKQSLSPTTEGVPTKDQTISANNSGWFAMTKPNPLARFRIFCFHDAGGNASLYHDWEKMLGDHFELIPVELPGRCDRSAEAPYANLSDLVHDLLSALIPVLDKPFYFFGHSLGGLLAFELTRELRNSNHALPEKIFISSTPALTTYSRREVDHTLSEEELISLFPHLRGDIIGDDELQRVLLDLLRADLKLITGYRYEKAEPLPVPLVVIHGTHDARVKKEQAEQWQSETTSSFKVISRPGGHRYIENDAEFLISIIEEDKRPIEKPAYV